ALAAGFVQAGLVPTTQIVAADPVPAALDAFSQAVRGARVESDGASVAKQADVLFLATKPQQLLGALGPLAKVAGADQLGISIAAGVGLARVGGTLSKARLVRVMPNTPCLIGQSASGYCLGPRATPADGQLVAQLLTAVGRAYAVDEKLLDAVTGLSGSGPAY